MNSFELAYSRLNAAQKQAVDTIYGPVAVIAGPGTGKTQLLTLRIANILKQTDVSPGNILALTYTEAGSFAMRDRLRSFIGSDALRVHISTFHSFCKSLIDTYPEKFVRSRRMKMLEELDARRLMGRLILSGDFTYLKPRHDPEMYMLDAIKIIGQLKREGIEPLDFVARVELAITDLPNNEAHHYKKDTKYGKKGDRKPTYAEEERKLFRQKEVGYVYRDYEKALVDEGWYDYDDMLLMVRERLRDDAEFLSILREQYQFVMVDEFQDTNSLQASIVDLIMASQEQPNILVVGDDEQSIYRFQGAVMQNVLDFCHRYESQDLQIITLTENYRSMSTVLEGSRAVIRNNIESLEKALNLDKTLHANVTHPARPIELIIAPDPALEIATMIQSMQRAHTEGAPWSEMAIIYRKNANPVHLIEHLRREQIPYVKQKGENLLHHPEAKKLLNTLRLIGNMHRDELFWEVMLYDFWGLDLHHLLRIQSATRASRNHEKKCLFEAFLGDDDMGIRIVVQRLIEFEKQAVNVTLVQFFEQFLETSGYRDFALRQPDRIERLSILNSFFDEMKNVNYLHPDYSVADFIHYIEDLDHYGLAPTTQPIRLYTDAVQLMTAHGSKGLEFDHVYIYDATANNWESSRDPSKLSITVSLFGEDIITRDVKRDLRLEEERRLWYVAMTRAKQRLIITSTESDERKKKPSFFITEIPEFSLEHLPLATDVEYIIQSNTAPVPPLDWSEATRAELAKRAKNYVLSVSGLNAWIRSPREFLEKYLIRQPAGKAPHMSFGTALHAGLQAIGNYVKKYNQLPSSDFWEGAVRDALLHEILTTQEKNDFERDAVRVIAEYLKKSDCPLTGRALVEYPLRNIESEGVRIQGVFDRLEILSETEAQVIDFKTGKSKKTAEQIADYERQLYFYLLLWQGTGESRTLVRGALDFVEDAPGGTVNRLYIDYAPAKLEILRGYIRAFKKSLDTLDFPEENTFLEDL